MMGAEQLILQFHELTCAKKNLIRRNSQLFCQRPKKTVGTVDCIGEIIEQVRYEERLSDAEFREKLSKIGCSACVEKWKNKIKIKEYSKKIGIVKNQMHTFAKRINKNPA